MTNYPDFKDQLRDTPYMGFCYVHEGIDVLAEAAPTLDEALGGTRRRAYRSDTGVNIQVLADPVGRPWRAMPALLPGATPRPRNWPPPAPVDHTAAGQRRPHTPTRTGSTSERDHCLTSSVHGVGLTLTLREGGR